LKGMGKKKGKEKKTSPYHLCLVGRGYENAEKIIPFHSIFDKGALFTREKKNGKRKTSFL